MAVEVNGVTWIHISYMQRNEKDNLCKQRISPGIF